MEGRWKYAGKRLGVLGPIGRGRKLFSLPVLGVGIAWQNAHLGSNLHSRVVGVLFRETHGRAWTVVQSWLWKESP